MKPKKEKILNRLIDMCYVEKRELSPKQFRKMRALSLKSSKEKIKYIDEFCGGLPF